MASHQVDVTVKIDRPKTPKELIGRVVYLHHQRGRGYIDSLGPIGTPLIVVEAYKGFVVVKSLGEVAAREYHVQAKAVSMVCPAEQRAGEASRKAAR